MTASITITDRPPSPPAIESRCRRLAVDVIEAWAEDRGVDVAELVFRMRTKSFKEGRR